MTGPGSGWFRNGAPGTPQCQSVQASVWARFLFTLHFTWDSRAFLWLQIPSGCQRPVGLFLHATCPLGSRRRHGPAWGHSPAGPQADPFPPAHIFLLPTQGRPPAPTGGLSCHPGQPSFFFLIVFRCCGCFWFLFVWLVFLASPHGMWNLSSLTRDRTPAPCSGSVEP